MKNRLFILCLALLLGFTEFLPLPARAESVLLKAIQPRVEESGDAAERAARDLLEILPEPGPVAANPTLGDAKLKKAFRLMHAFYTSSARRILPQIPLDLEKKFANEFFDGFFAEGDNPPELVAKMNGVIARLSPFISRKDLKAKVGILGGGGIMGFAKGGEWIVITDEMAAWPPDQIAGILAHELCHLVKRDFVKILLIPCLNKALTARIREDLRPDFGKLTAFFLARFQRFSEFETDVQAARLMKQAGFSPQGLVEVLRRIDTGPVDPRQYLVADHPTCRDRIAALEKSGVLGN
ncbi:MAG TPA: M48 family metalloprotease [Candidatus Ozemobacteraceae bacterium]|nr:M48 family metalloprotease [Candidatus Ozemobacteraceae bacterium]HQG27175.1 M48 family metalloprotease [Candidatus Ozemobacteraceae bacterium]